MHAGLPYELLAFLYELHQVLIEIVLLVVSAPHLLFVSLHALLVERAGDVVGVAGEARHLDSTHPALMAAVPGDGGGQRAINRTFWHGYRLVVLSSKVRLGLAYQRIANTRKKGVEKYQKRMKN